MSLGDRLIDALQSFEKQLPVAKAVSDIGNNISDIISDGGGVDDIKDYMAVSSQYLYTWSDVQYEYGKHGYFTVKLFYKGKLCGRILIKSIRGEPPEEVDWIKEGF